MQKYVEFNTFGALKKLAVDSFIDFTDFCQTGLALLLLVNTASFFPEQCKRFQQAANHMLSICAKIEEILLRYAFHISLLKSKFQKKIIWIQ